MKLFSLEQLRTQNEFDLFGLRNIEGSLRLTNPGLLFFYKLRQLFKSRIVVEALKIAMQHQIVPTLPTMKKSCPKSGNNKLIVSSLQMTFPREKGCVTEIFKPPARFSVHLECDPAFECALFTLCIYPLKKSNSLFGKTPIPHRHCVQFYPMF